jgi:hypothetical protein
VAPRGLYGRVLCEQRAERALGGLGDPTLGEWREWTGTAFHLRRRLKPHEQVHVGPALDVRGTPEAHRRVDALPSRLRALLPPDVLADELGALP